MRDYERDLYRFSEMDDVEVAEDDPDVRGWDVIAQDGRELGEVKDLLVDRSSMKVRCLEVELEGSQFNWKDNRRVAIPVDSIAIDEEHDDVIVQGLGFEEIGRLDEYRPSRWESGGTTLTGHEAGTSTASERNRITRSEEELTIGKHEVEAGEVRVGKHVETERINEPVSRMRERVRIERRPVSEQTRGAAPFGDEEIRVPLHEEEVHVEKRPVVKEELVISKERVEETKNVQADVKKERFDVDKQGRVLDEGDDPLRRRR